jgi:type IV pilus assembly protein PilQ
VRLLIQLREEVPFEARKEGNNLLIEIERPKKVETKKETPAEVQKEEAGLAAVKAEPKKEELKKEEAKKEEPKREEAAKIEPPKIEQPKIEPAKIEEPKALPVSKKPEKALAAPSAPPPRAAKGGDEGKKILEEGLPEKVYAGSRLSLDFKDADVKNILRLIAEVSNFNIIAGDDVTGKITMRLVDVPWDQALEVILQARGLGMSKVGNVIRIAPVDSLKKEIQAELEAKRLKDKLEDLITDLIPINYASAKEILPQIKSILSERGDVKFDERTNILIVKDIPRNIVAVKGMVKSLDTRTPQVMIEARIVEANLTFQRELGISWGFLAHEGPDKNRELSVGGGTGNASSLRAPIGTPSVNTRKLVDLPATGGSVLEFLFTSDHGLRNLDVAISASESEGDVKVISSPKIATLDNKEASVEQGLRIPYLKLTTEGTVTTDFIDANLKLTVTPHVTNDGYIRMSIKAKKDAPDDSITVQGVPSIDKKEAITEVMVRDGGVVAIAGIYTIDRSKTTDGVPLFRKIPVLGWLFKRETRQDDRRDLLIFISPKIMKDQVL